MSTTKQSSNLLKGTIGPLSNILAGGEFSKMQKTLKAIQGLTHFSNIAESIAPIVAAQNAFSKSFNATTPFIDNSILKTIAGANFSSQLGIRGALIDQLSTIATNQHKIAAAMAPAFRFDPSFALATQLLAEEAIPRRLASFQVTIANLNKHIASSWFQGIDPEIAKKFVDATNRAAKITEDISEKNFATIDDLQNLENFIGDSLETFQEKVTDQIKKASNSPMTIISFWLTIISFIITLYSLYLSLNPAAQQPNAASKEQIEDLKHSLENTFKNAIDKITPQCIVNRTCSVNLKPTSKSAIIYKLKQGENINLVDTMHKWAHITIVDPSDGLPVTGWILKKYLFR